MGAPNAAVLLTRSQRARQHVVEREYTRKQKKSKKVKERPGTAGNAPGALQIAQPIPVLMTAGKPRLIKGLYLHSEICHICPSVCKRSALLSAELAVLLFHCLMCFMHPLNNIGVQFWYKYSYEFLPFLT